MVRPLVEQGLGCLSSNPPHGAKIRIPPKCSPRCGHCVRTNNLAVDTREVSCLSPPHVCFPANTHFGSAARAPMVSLHSQPAAIWPPPAETGEYLERKVNNLSFKQYLLSPVSLTELWLNIASFIQQMYPECAGSQARCSPPAPAP